MLFVEKEVSWKELQSRGKSYRASGDFAVWHNRDQQISIGINKHQQQCQLVVFPRLGSKKSQPFLKKTKSETPLNTPFT
jgi:hypothetical protein